MDEAFFGEHDLQQQQDLVISSVSEHITQFFNGNPVNPMGINQLTETLFSIFEVAASSLNLPEIQDTRKRDKKRESIKSGIRNHILRIVESTEQLDGCFYQIIRSERGKLRADMMNMNLMNSVLQTLNDDLEKYFIGSKIETRLRPPLHYFFSIFCLNPNSDVFTTGRQYFSNFNCAKLCISMLIQYINDNAK